MFNVVELKTIRTCIRICQIRKIETKCINCKKNQIQNSKILGICIPTTKDKKLNECSNWVGKRPIISLFHLTRWSGLQHRGFTVKDRS